MLQAHGSTVEPVADPAWIVLLNSDWRDHRGNGRRDDRLERAGWRRSLLDGLATDASAIPEARLLAGLRELRAVLRRNVERVVARGTAGGGSLQDLNRLLGLAPLLPRVVLRGGTMRVEFAPRAGPIDALVGEIAAGFAAALAAGDVARIKICRNSDCQWVFYDRSRNRSRKWCEAATCANIMKVRRFRQRHRADGR